MQTASRLHFGEEESWGPFRYSRLCGYLISTRAPTNTAVEGFRQDGKHILLLPSVFSFPGAENADLPL